MAGFALTISSTGVRPDGTAALSNEVGARIAAGRANVAGSEAEYVRRIPLVTDGIETAVSAETPEPSPTEAGTTTSSLQASQPVRATGASNVKTLTPPPPASTPSPAATATATTTSTPEPTATGTPAPTGPSKIDTIGTAAASPTASGGEHDRPAGGGAILPAAAGVAEGGTTTQFCSGDECIVIPEAMLTPVRETESPPKKAH
ncbi:MAG: hypothetical protein HYX53_04970 [Chloroflexi bacterium]|nr:hypothetical protein [Chloroflexota bacterium]